MIKPKGKQGWPEKNAVNAAKVNMIERCPELLGQPRGTGKSHSFPYVIILIS